MTEITVLIEPAQERKIVNALRKGKGCRIKVRKPITDESPMNRDIKGKLVLTASQMKRYQKAPPGSSVALPFKHEHLQRNMHCKGGFLPLLAPALIPIISGVAGGLIEKEIAGSGIHPPKIVWYKRSMGHKPSVAFQIDPAPHGNGVVFAPWYIPGREHLFKTGTGLYLSPYPHKHGAAIETVDQLKGFSTEQKQAILNLL